MGGEQFKAIEATIRVADDVLSHHGLRIRRMGPFLNVEVRNGAVWLSSVCVHDFGLLVLTFLGVHW